jgi:histidine ammonia-lyase
MCQRGSRHAVRLSALAPEALKPTKPATASSRSTEVHIQDNVSMGTIAVVRAGLAF